MAFWCSEAVLDFFVLAAQQGGRLTHDETDQDSLILRFAAGAQSSVFSLRRRLFANRA